MNHPEAWCGSQITIGWKTYNKAQAIAAADRWLCGHPIASDVKATSPAWTRIPPTYNTLTDYNAGKRRRGCGCKRILPRQVDAAVRRASAVVAGVLPATLKNAAGTAAATVVR
jgi:hypothetical protein